MERAIGHISVANNGRGQVQRAYLDQLYMIDHCVFNKSTLTWNCVRARCAFEFGQDLRHIGKEEVCD